MPASVVEEFDAAERNKEDKMPGNTCAGMKAPDKGAGKVTPGKQVPPSKSKKRGKGEIGAYLRMKKKGAKMDDASED